MYRFQSSVRFTKPQQSEFTCEKKYSCLTRIMSHFDNLILMVRGRCVYNGPTGAIYTDHVFAFKQCCHFSGYFKLTAQYSSAKMNFLVVPIRICFGNYLWNGSSTLTYKYS